MAGIFLALAELPGFKAVRVPHLPAQSEAGRRALKNANEKNWYGRLAQSVGLTCLNRTDRIIYDRILEYYSPQPSNKLQCTQPRATKTQLTRFSGYRDFLNQTIMAVCLLRFQHRCRTTAGPPWTFCACRRCGGRIFYRVRPSRGP